MRRLLIVAALVVADVGGYVSLTDSHSRAAKSAVAAGNGDGAAAVGVAPAAVYPPRNTGKADPRGFVIYFSDADGWTEAEGRTAAAIADKGFAVAGVDSRGFLDALEASRETCVHPVQPLVNLAGQTQADLGWHQYRHPILAGQGLGGTIAYAALAQAVPGIFTAGVSTGFADVLPGTKRWCSLNGYTAARVTAPAAGWRPGPASRLPTPWRVLEIADAAPADPAVAAILAGSPGTGTVAASSEAEGLAAALAALPGQAQSSSQ